MLQAIFAKHSSLSSLRLLCCLGLLRVAVKRWVLGWDASVLGSTSSTTTAISILLKSCRSMLLRCGQGRCNGTSPSFTNSILKWWDQLLWDLWSLSLCKVGWLLLLHQHLRMLRIVGIMLGMVLRMVLQGLSVAILVSCWIDDFDLRG